MSQPNLVAVLQTWGSNFTSNVSNTFSNLSLRDYIRIIWIVGGYLFLRPYLDKGFAKLQNRGAAKMESAEREESERAAAETTTRGTETTGSGDGQEQGAEESKKVPQWGKSARTKQEKYMEWLEKESERLQQEEDDKDIADLLEE
jgi:hypothetical protein